MKKVLLTIFLISSCTFIYINHKNNIKIKDLNVVYQQLQTNHPGFYNDQDTEFKQVLDQGYNKAKKEIYQQHWWQDHIPLLQKYLKNFNDSHLRIYKNNISLETASNTNTTQSIFIEKLSDSITLIHIPTYMPNEQQQKQFQVVIQAIPSIKDQDAIIFDLRGNSGGNSELGTQILQALFGKQYVNQQLYELYKNETVWWRASNDNSKHIDNLVAHFSKHKNLNNELLLWLNTINKGIKGALKNNHIFYIQKESNYTKPTKFISCPLSSKIIVVIDENNVSASLDFITELQALTNNIIFIGHDTNADTIYMEVRLVALPSKKATLQYPIKLYHNRPRGNNENYKADITCPYKEINDTWIKETIFQILHT